jgi:hypothetical protein
MIPRNGDQLAGGVDPCDTRAQPRQRLGEQPGAAADIERSFPFQRPAAALVDLPMLIDPVADLFEPHRIQLVEHR